MRQEKNAGYKGPRPQNKKNRPQTHVPGAARLSPVTSMKGNNSAAGMEKLRCTRRLLCA